LIFAVWTNGHGPLGFVFQPVAFQPVTSFFRVNLLLLTEIVLQSALVALLTLAQGTSTQEITQDTGNGADSNHGNSHPCTENKRKG
jgi:hypothetical protein